jgi:hypothetical protein
MVRAAAGHDLPRLDLMIVGAPKAGTSSLFAYISQHPEVRGARRDEMSYFVDDREYAAGYPRAFATYFGRRVQGDYTYVAKLAGLMYQPLGIERLREHNPEVVVVVILRNPVDRARSAYLHARRRGVEDAPTFEAAIAAEPGRRDSESHEAGVRAYLARSMYLPAIESLKQAFPRDQLKIFLLEDLAPDPCTVSGQLYQAIGVDPAFTPRDLERRNEAADPRWPRITRATAEWNRGRSIVRACIPALLRDRLRGTVRKKLEVASSAPPLNPETRATLVEYFRSHNDHLAEELGRDLSTWNA